MKKFLLGIIFFLTFINISLAFDPMNMPKFSEYVNDYSNILDSNQKAELNTIAKDYENKTTNQIIVVLFPNRNGNELLDIGLKAFRENGIGQKTKNNGTLLLISTEEKKIRIVTGYGLEGDIPDALASDIIEKSIRPGVNSGDYYTGIKNYYSRITKSIGSGEGKNFTKFNGPSSLVMLPFGLVFGLIAGLNIASFITIIFFFSYLSYLMGSYALILGYIVGSLITMGIGFKYFKNFKKNFFEKGKSGGGRFGGGGFGGGSGGGGGFSGGGGSSGGGGAGD